MVYFWQKPVGIPIYLLNLTRYHIGDKLRRIKAGLNP